MGASGGGKQGKGKGGGGKNRGRKVRVAFKRNRSKPRRDNDWTQKVDRDEGEDHVNVEGVRGKGDLSRFRTIVVRDGLETRAEDLAEGIVVAMRGLYADVDDGERVWPCTIRRVLRTRLTAERHPVTVGDFVHFTLLDGDDATREGVIESVAERTGVLRRKSGKRIHAIAANVDQVLVVSSAGEPAPKPNLIDRCLVAASFEEIEAIVCMNKIDLDVTGYAKEILERYRSLGYRTLATSAVEAQGIDALREVLRDRRTAVAGQSGVGKSSLLNAVQPGLALRVGEVGHQNQKGRHTTTTARLLRLTFGGYVVDTPGFRSFDLSLVPRHEYEAHFVEFVVHVQRCKYPDCTHTHEDSCAVIQAVEEGLIDPERYRSYLQIYEDPGTVL